VSSDFDKIAKLDFFHRFSLKSVRFPSKSANDVDINLASQEYCRDSLGELA
jgi:hypothetical protein